MSTLTIATGGTVRMPVRQSRTARMPVQSARAARADGTVGQGRPAPLHLTRRGRLVVLALAVLAAFAVTFAGSGAAASGAGSQAPVVERYVVAPGDTLWDIAEGLAAPGEDVRDVVAELVLLNGLPSAGLTAGQEIVLPAGR